MSNPDDAPEEQVIEAPEASGVSLTPNAPESAQPPQAAPTPEAILREELLSALGDLLLSQGETLRLADQWSRYEANIDAAAQLVVDHLNDGSGSLPARLDEARTRLEANADLSADQRAQALWRALDEVIRVGKEDSQRRRITAFRSSGVRRRDLGLLSSQLVTLAADFELFVLRVMSAWIEFDPSLLAERKREFTFIELGQIDSVEEVRTSMIQAYLEDHMRKSAVAWFKVFCDAFGAKSIEGIDDFVTREVFQRRHIIVHHGGTVSRTYMANLEDYSHGASLGNHLPVDLNYIQAAADALGIVAHSATLAALYKSAPNAGRARTKVEKEAGELTFLLLSQDRDALVERFGSAFDLNRLKDEFAREQTRVNLWVAKRRRGSLKDRSEIELWDTSAKDSMFKLARFVLLRDIDSAAVLARRMIDSGELNELTISRWALFEEVREDLLAALTAAADGSK